MQIPKAFELVGLVYSAWFTYRYLLYKVRSHSAWRAVPDWLQRQPTFIRGIGYYRC